MAENPVSTRPPLARKPHRYKVDEGLDVRFLCHANSAHVLQTLWRGLIGANTSVGSGISCAGVSNDAIMDAGKVYIPQKGPSKGKWEEGWNTLRQTQCP